MNWLDFWHEVAEELDRVLHHGLSQTATLNVIKAVGLKEKKKGKKKKNMEEN